MSPVLIAFAGSLTSSGLLRIAAALAVAPACVHSVPVRVGPDDSIAFIDDGPTPVRFRGGEPAPVEDDWKLVVVTRDHEQREVEAPLTLVHGDNALRVHGPEDDFGNRTEHSFPDAQTRALYLERPNVGGTVAVVAVSTVVGSFAMWSLYQLFTVGER